MIPCRAFAYIIYYIRKDDKMKNFMKKLMAILVMASMVLTLVPVSFAANEVKTEEKIYKLWYDEQAPDESADGIINPTHNDPTSGWERNQLPIGNGYMGAAIFGRTDRERVQLSDKTLHSTDKGLMNFAETYIYFNHDEASVSNYYRDLNINDALASVSYDYNGVTYTREYLTSYPDNVLAIKLTASGSGNLNFSLEPMIPFLASETSVAEGTRSTNNIRTGTVVADETTDNTITLSGHLTGYEIDYEAQYRIVPTGGTMVAANTVTDGVADKGKITVTGADSAIIYVALDTNYKLSSDTFTKSDSVKLAGNPHPHDAVTARIEAATVKGYDAIKADHVADVSEYFDRVKIDFGTTTPNIPTDELLNNYQNGTEDKYLDELLYQYGRYMLIASSREGTLPAHLTGVWNAYDAPLCLAGYWHNINVQMNYWGVFSANLAEMFESYVDLYEAYLPDVTADASNYIKTAHPNNWDSSGNNGWGVSTRVTPYGAYATRTGGIDGAATGSMTADLLWDYYEFTGDQTILEEIAYPAISGSANYVSRQMEELDAYPGLLLIPKSGSPENNAPEINADGTAFAQGFAYSNYLDTLKGAELLGIDDSDTVISRINSQIDKIDPIQVGYSGQIKEFREETVYGEYGEWNHRHISHLMGAFPADFINSATPAWQDASAVSIAMRGPDAPNNWGWQFAHRMGVYARVNDGNNAYNMYQRYIKEMISPNLWGIAAFQIDGNFGTMAGVNEMLLHSHEGAIEPLASMPDAWEDGSYDGLVARGNFVVGATWSDSQADEFRITSRNGGECNVKYRNIANATVKDSDGNTVSFTADGDVITFNTEAGKSYVITDIPTHEKLSRPADLAVEYTDGSDANITWSEVSGATKYNVYRATNSSPTYELVAENVTATSYTMENVAGENQYTYAVTALNNDGDESLRAVCTTIAALTPESATGTYLDSTTLQLEIDKSSTATGYRVFANGEFVMESPYSVIVLDNADSSKTYTVKAVIDELVGAEVQVASADTTVSKKALYDEIVRADAIDLSQYDETFATSITNEKNKAIAVLEKTATEAEVATATAELKNVIDNLDMIVALSKITSSNARIIPMDTTIAVLSHTTESTHKISSATLISALSIESGYTLSYVDANKEANASSHVIDGYVKVTKSGLDDMYIPIVKKGAVIDDNIQNNTVTNTTTNASFAFAGGIGGKAEDDIAGVITAVGTPIVKMPRIHIGSSTATDATALKKLPYTIKFKVYADGNTTAAVNYRWTDANDTYRLFRWYPDGTYKYNVNGALVEGGTLAREQWHDVALVYCSQLNKYMLYINGELQEGYSGSIAGTYYSLVYLAMENDSTNGTVAYSDLEAYYGYYYPPFKPTPEHLLSTMTSNSDYVAVGSSAISVFSHPSNATYQLSSADVVSALSADEGWTLTYVNSNKETATPDHVKSGYIKASHADYADVFIPVTYKGAVIDNDHSDNAATLNGTAKATYSYADGVGTFTAGATAIDGYAFTGIGAGTGQAGAIERKPYTIAFKVKTTGDATGSINWRWDGDGFEFLKFNAVDGKFTYRTSSGMVEGGSFANDVWHDVVVVYDQPINTYQIWIDGAYIANTAAVPGSDASHYSAKVDFCIATGSVNGTVSYKDFDTHYGYYYAPFTPTATYLLGTMTSDNSYVVVGTDAVSVLSHPTDATYQVSSTALVSALSVEDGWTLTYVDANKNTATTDHVTAGYLKASHSDYDDIYIPISAKGDDIANNIGTTATNYGNASTAATYSYADGVVTFTAGETELTGYKLTGIGAGTGNAGAILQLPYTMKFKMKTTGDAIGVVNMRNESDGQNLVRFNADGTYQYRGTADNMLNGGSIAEDVWHDVVLVYDQPANKYQIWVDGKCLIDNSGNVAGSASNHYSSKIVFAIATGSANGTVEFKDFEGYYGYYTVVEDVEEVVVPDDMTMTHLATSEVYEKDGVEYVFVAVTTPSAADLSLYNTFVCTDGETTKGIALTDIVTTTVTGESEIAIIVKNVLNVNADNFKAAITATEIDEMD